MSGSKKDRVFDLEAVYTAAEAAEFIGQTEDWIVREAIKSGELQYAPLGNSQVVTGRWLLEYVKFKGTFHGDPNCPVSRRGRSRRKKTEGEESMS